MVSLSETMQARALRGPNRRLESWVSVAPKDWDAMVPAVAALEAENAALRGFVAAYDVIADNLLDAFPDDNFIVGIIPAMRDRLAAEHGLPLPGAGEGA